MTGRADFLRAAGFPGRDCPQISQKRIWFVQKRQKIEWKTVRGRSADFAPTGCIRVSLGMHGIKISQFSIFCSQILNRYAILGAEGGERMQRLIFHVDVNSAFFSWGSGAARCGREPICGSSVRHRRRPGQAHHGILAKSIPAKAFGVTTGEPVGMALRKCPAEAGSWPAGFCCIRKLQKRRRRLPPRARQGAGFHRRMLPRHDRHGCSIRDPVAIAHIIKRYDLPELARFGQRRHRCPISRWQMASDFKRIRYIRFRAPRTRSSLAAAVSVRCVFRRRSTAQCRTSIRIDEIQAQADLAYIHRGLPALSWETHS